jgi:hypothetical protein
LKSTKYQLLQSDYEFVCKQLKLYKEIIQQSRKYDLIGRLVTVEGKEVVYVVWNYYDADDLVLLFELDRPNDGEQLVLKRDEIHLLEPLEIVERITEWK